MEGEDGWGGRTDWEGQGEEEEKNLFCYYLPGGRRRERRRRRAGRALSLLL